MVTFRAYKKPDKLDLPEKYQRLAMETREGQQGTNYTFIKYIGEDNATKMYLLGEYFELKETKNYPEKGDLEPREYVYPTLYTSYLFVPDKGKVIHAIGNNPDSVDHVLSSHSEIKSLFVIPINLDDVEIGFRRGLIKISGHSYKSQQGTIKSIVRKVDPVAFSPDEESYARGDDIDKEYLEVLIDFNGVKRFRVYPSGKITTGGRPPSDSTGYEMMMVVYQRIQDVLRSLQSE